MGRECREQRITRHANTRAMRAHAVDVEISSSHAPLEAPDGQHRQGLVGLGAVRALVVLSWVMRVTASAAPDPIHKRTGGASRQH